MFSDWLKMIKKIISLIHEVPLWCTKLILLKLKAATETQDIPLKIYVSINTSATTMHVDVLNQEKDYHPALIFIAIFFLFDVYLFAHSLQCLLIQG